MEWLLIVTLPAGEVAELPASKADCYGALDTAKRTGWATITLQDKRQFRVPALSLACVEWAPAPLDFRTLPPPLNR